MKKGVLVTISNQANNAIQYTMQDQQYLPRTMNYLNLEHSEFIWEVKAMFDLNEEVIQAYDAAALTPLTQKYKKKLRTFSPDLQFIDVPYEKFYRSFASRGATIGMTTGYVVAEAPTAKMKDFPAQPQATPYADDHLRALMRAYPTIYWEVVSFDTLKEKLAHHTKNITVALAPAAEAYQKFIHASYPNVRVISAKIETDDRGRLKEQTKDEQRMLLIAGVTTLLLGLLAFF